MRRLPFRKLQPVALAAVFLLALPALVVAATPRDELLRLVPDDVGFCVVLQNLRTQSKALLASPFVAQFRASPLGQALQHAPEAAKLIQADVQLKKYLHVSWAQLRDDIFGEAVVLAYRPGPPDKPDQEQGIILIRAHDPQLLAALVDRINEVQRQSHDLQALEERRFEDAIYYCRVERRGKSYYYVRGPVLGFSRQEDLLRETLGRALHSSESEPFVLRQLRRCGVADDLVAWWINPRAFDAHLQARAAATGDPTSTIVKAVLAYWKPLDGIALSLSVGSRALELKMTLLAQPEQMPAAVRPAFEGQEKPSELWARFPDNAILAMAGRFDAVAWTKWLGDFLPPDARAHCQQVLMRGPGAALGKDICTEVLPYLGPDWGFCVLPPATDKSWVPQSLAALRIRPDGQTPPLEQVLLNGMNALAGLAVISYNSNHDQPLMLRTTMQGKTEIRSLSGSGALPPGLEPAYAFKDGYLVLASSPAALSSLRTQVLTPITGKPDVPLVRLSLRALGQYLSNHLDALAAHLAEKDHTNRSEMQHRLKDLIAVMGLLDRLEMLERATPGRLTTVLRMSTRQPLDGTAQRTK
ncbi:MAG TPA: hypothetical protein VFA18_21810 [Gemmataceae bacterium]|nr:hypothetical protein [Gemmataceae bacterium]